MEVLNCAKYFGHAPSEQSPPFSHHTHQLHGRGSRTLRNHFFAIFARNDEQAIFCCLALFQVLIVEKLLFPTSISLGDYLYSNNRMAIASSFVFQYLLNKSKALFMNAKIDDMFELAFNSFLHNCLGLTVISSCEPFVFLISVFWEFVYAVCKCKCLLSIVALVIFAVSSVGPMLKLGWPHRFSLKRFFVGFVVLFKVLLV